MERRTFVAAAAGGIALTTGCTGSLDDTGDPGETGSQRRGTVRFYVSDEPNHIDDFETLDVTISGVSFEPAGEDDEDGSDGNESEPDEESPDGNETDGSDEPDDGESDDGNESESDGGDESDGPESGRGGWLEYDLDDPTVDLTQLEGPKATVVDDIDVPAGEYVAVDLFVADVHAVLTDGTETSLKIPSERLKLRSNFTVGADEEIEFVYDIAPKRAGRSGTYILTPVISESGTDAEIEEVDATRSGAESG